MMTVMRKVGEGDGCVVQLKENRPDKRQQTSAHTPPSASPLLSDREWERTMRGVRKT
jgi:hypothetical protein